MVDGTFALDGGAEARRWKQGHAKRKQVIARNAARLKAYDDRCARLDREQRRKARVAYIERIERRAWRKARRAQGYTIGLPYKDLTGQRFGLLVVVRPGGHRSSGSKKWWVRCDCGSPDKEVAGTNLKQGNIRSCGFRCQGHVRSDWHKPETLRRWAAKKDAKLAAEPISVKVQKLSRTFKRSSPEAKLLRRARDLLEIAERVGLYAVSGGERFHCFSNAYDLCR